MIDGQGPTELVPVVVPPTEVARIPTIPNSRPRGEPGFLLRAVWFIFIGWWLSALAIGVAYFLCVIIVGLPLAFMIFNQLPAILTLRPRSADPTGFPVEQHPIWIRAIWFLLVGWWLGASLHDRRVRPVRDPDHSADRPVAVQPGRGGHDAAAVLKVKLTGSQRRGRPKRGPGSMNGTTMACTAARSRGRKDEMAQPTSAPKALSVASRESAGRRAESRLEPQHESKRVVESLDRSRVEPTELRTEAGPQGTSRADRT